ncbi:mitotic control protein dis3 [Capsaspora owczarzaki ATCC 30864]|uniref:Ribosomal RNA-processing protein 44 n=1 Tax=Capsaspora owczarzaki (strain ATCC 30864) TaxID=595528 RepID=A0A0D2WQK4_CAPO3|nr:mitotic control protein dis3 [Capsaspora owczarzaki ATCC 30864]KJE93975.1 mitotic control protein dis3 [Capsaspora owczarzaki ATCC 30864]|eukprot:XP_004347431.1 mitotic control protein dis3 [Capsaspora owczarzaki ATCC 30864]
MMIRSKSFVKKTRKGNVVKIVREHYLRDDVWCGAAGCAVCAQSHDASLESSPSNANAFFCATSSKGNSKAKASTLASASASSALPAHYILPDTNVVLHQMDLLEHPTIKNVIILQTVLDEVRHQNLSLHQRLRAIISDPGRHFHVFVNEHRRETYVEREKDESTNDRNDRAIRVAALWYNHHLSNLRLPVVLLTNDRANLAKAEDSGIPAFTVHRYIESCRAQPELTDLLAFADLDDDTPARAAGMRANYPEHLTTAKLLTGVKLGLYYQGVLQVNRDNPLEASVRARSMDTPILVHGRLAMSRAMQDDVVIVKLLPQSQWLTPSTQLLEDESAEADDAAAEMPDDEQSESDEDEPDDAESAALDAEAIASTVADEQAAVAEAVDSAVVGSSSDARRPTGIVVGILRRAWRPSCGMVIPVESDSNGPSSDNGPTQLLFVPTDTRFPHVRVQTRRPQAYLEQRVVVTIDRWHRGSRLPEGHLVRALGPIGEKMTETEVLLVEHEVRHSDFSPAVLADLPVLPWVITEADRAARRDFTHLDICSVDPPGCTDIDDALHVRPLENGNWEVGVHIADVSHFIKPNTAIDLEAARRGTSVYLIGRRIDMIPELLGTELCSLQSDVERFAMSVVWEITPPGKPDPVDGACRTGAEIVRTEYCRSIIRSRASLTYMQAQTMIDDQTRRDPLSHGLRGLNELSKVLRQRRLDRGTLTLESPEISFSLDKDTSDPVDVGAKQKLQTMSMVEEFMLLANVAVAEHIFRRFPQCAVLRRHPVPPQASFEPLVVAARQHGVEIKASNSKELAESLDRAEESFGKAGKPYLGKLLRILATRCMMQAVYFCSGTLPTREHQHYGLACPIYTHFTSPIRRYPDVLVHRLLAVAIGLETPTRELLDKPKVSALTDWLNRRHRMAQYAQRSSVELHTILFFKRLGVAEEDAHVLRLRDNAIVVLIPKFGLEGTVHLSDYDSANIELSRDGYKLTIHDAVKKRDHVFTVFDRVRVRVTIDATNLQKQKVSMRLLDPFITNLSVEATAVDKKPAVGKAKETSTEEALQQVVDAALAEQSKAAAQDQWAKTREERLRVARIAAAAAKAAKQAKQPTMGPIQVMGAANLPEPGNKRISKLPQLAAESSTPARAVKAETIGAAPSTPQTKSAQAPTTPATSASRGRTAAEADLDAAVETPKSAKSAKKPRLTK